VAVGAAEACWVSFVFMFRGHDIVVVVGFSPFVTLASISTDAIAARGRGKGGGRGGGRAGLLDAIKARG